MFFSNEKITVGVAGIAIVVLCMVITFALSRRANRQRRTRDEELAARELATIVEEIQITAGGVICFILLIGTIVLAISAYSTAATVFQQIEAGVSLIAGCILWGLGVALGRRRTYRIYRSERREAYPER